MGLISLFGSPLKTGDRAPDFCLQDQSGHTHQLKDYRGRWVVLFFYPKDGSLVCTREACSFRDESDSFQNLNAVVLGVNTDTLSSHREFADKNTLNYPVLSDFTAHVSQEYGVLLPGGMSNRVTFLIDPQGQIAQKLEWVSWLNYGKSVASALADLQSHPTAT